MDGDLRYLRTRLLSWSKENYRAFPWRKTQNPYRVCVAEIMLHQTFARKVAPVYNAFIKRYPNPRRLSRANVAYVEKMIRPLGLLYRARMLKRAALYVMKKYRGKFPVDMDSLMELPGVGSYTASSVLCFAYGRQVPVIDANVVRVYSRYFGIGTKLPNSAPSKGISEIAAKALPRGRAREFNYALLDFASAICSHYNPKHEICPVKRRCKFVRGMLPAPEAKGGKKRGRK